MVLKLTNRDIIGLNVARDNMYNNKHIWARKIGFGFGENDNVPNDINAWNNKQIDKSFETSIYDFEIELLNITDLSLIHI